MASREWSAQQRAIFDWFKSGSGHLVVRARAGTGKTTTILEAISYASGLILLAAFNRRIAMELQNRLQNPNAKASTLHALGGQVVRKYWERIRADDDDTPPWQRRDYLLTEQVCSGAVPDAIKKLVRKLHTLGREIQPHARKLGDLTDLALQFQCDPDPQWADRGFDLQYIEQRALNAMDAAASIRPMRIDFADMIFLPVRNQWLAPMYDGVIVDEAQDMTMAQLELARGVCKPNGRMAIVGDDRQGIYSFRGADSNALDRLKAELQATELPLTVTYRCGRVIVDEAKRLVPDFQAGPNNPAGEIRQLPTSKLVADVEPTRGDFVLSRKNAPLAGIAMACIRAQKRVRIAGKDIGRGLVDIIKGLKAVTTPEFLTALDTWAQAEIDKAWRVKREARIEQINDNVETLIVLAEGTTTTTDILQRIDALFTDNLESAGFVTCSSVHKAKGLEADHVYVLRDTLYSVPPKPKNGNGRKPLTPEAEALRQREEQNIEYVAITRAKHVLTWVSDSAPAPEPPKAELFAAEEAERLARGAAQPDAAPIASVVQTSVLDGAASARQRLAPAVPEWDAHLAECDVCASPGDDAFCPFGAVLRTLEPRDAVPTYLDVQRVDASTLGLQPGEWPMSVTYQGRRYRRSQMPWPGCVAVIYDAPNGAVLEVAND